MCVICCSYEEPLVPLRASHRLTAARADQQQAKTFLEHIGFTGLKFKGDLEDRVNFAYSGVDLATLKKNFGPVTSNSSGSVSGKFGKFGSLVFWPAKKLVVLRNSQKGGAEAPAPKAKTPVQPPVVPTVKQAPPKPDPTKTGTENDDSKVPDTHISKSLEHAYTLVGTNRQNQMLFMTKLWKELNATKFGGRLFLPRLAFLKEQGAGKMRLRGVWYAQSRTLKISPRLFNATQNFFVEVFLHEMCHQATHELSNMNPAQIQENRKHKGHGSVWAAWMRKVGLNPSRYDPNENSVYMTQEEKEIHDKKRESWEQTKKDAEDQGLRPARMRMGAQVIVRRAEGLEKGIVVCTTGKTTNRWAILPLETVERGTPPTARFTWYINNPPTVAYADPTGKDWSGDQRFEQLAYVIVRQYERKSERRSVRRQMRW